MTNLRNEIAKEVKCYDWHLDNEYDVADAIMELILAAHLEQQARIAELEAERAEADRLLEECQDIMARYKTNREELEARLHVYEGCKGQPVSRTGVVDEMSGALKQKDERIAELEAERDHYAALYSEGRNTYSEMHVEIEELEAKLQSERQSHWEVADSEMKRRAETAEAKLAKAIVALTSIEEWAGEFPPTGKFWSDGKPMSYAAAYGSDGERDFMREKARTTLVDVKGQT